MSARTSKTTVKSSAKRTGVKTSAGTKKASRTNAKTAKSTASKSVRKTVAKQPRTTRKAPTTVTKGGTSPRSRLQIGWVTYTAMGIIVVAGAASAGIGMSDSGAIDIDGVVNERRAQATPEEQADLNRVSERRGATQAVDGGLVPSENQESKSRQTTPAASATSSTATSTTATSSDTDAKTATSSEAEATTSAESEPETVEEPDGGLVPSTE